MHILGVDPSKDYTGMGLVHTGRPLTDALTDWVSVRVGETDAVKGFRERLLPALVRMAMAAAVAGDSTTAMLVERPPPSSRADMGHGAQAPIGDAQGVVGGLCLGFWIGNGRPVHGRVDVGSDKMPGWRQTMFVVAARHGLLLQPPGARRVLPLRVSRGKVRRPTDAHGLVTAGFLLSYQGCAHEILFANYEALKAAPDHCPDCSKEPTGSDRRDQWKANACEFVKYLWPDQYADIVRPARERAHTVNKPEHQLAGVADVCEAIAIAVHGREAVLNAARRLDLESAR